MTTYGDNTNNPFYHHVRPGYRYTYAFIDQYVGAEQRLAALYESMEGGEV